jgi:hypothetical protein
MHYTTKAKYLSSYNIVDILILNSNCRILLLKDSYYITRCNPSNIVTIYSRYLLFRQSTVFRKG